ncbi:MAG: CbbQ/NirQ/NorQ/GpvN family protein [Desulfobulbaceae bacterium]|nr:MAG: CbbQ/NirQ/NorQ/GpvN family protein [Desulfobulbaceae bacterium]
MHPDNYDKTSHLVKEEPYYLEIGNEVEIGITAHQKKLPLLLKGPTGCGKTRYMKYLAWRLGRPLFTVSCHDDLSTSDLVGRFLIKGEDTVWVDGPLTSSVRNGGICYLDEIVEARKDTTVVIHPLADDRRALPIDKLSQIIEAPDSFMLAVSYNPGYQSILKDLKPSTRQRFVSISFDYPEPQLEQEIIVSESGVDESIAARLVTLAEMTRGLKESGLPEGASTRLLIQTGLLIEAGISVRTACRVGLVESLSDDPDLLGALNDMADAVF